MDKTCNKYVTNKLVAEKEEYIYAVFCRQVGQW
jgi:hypothetical protein